MKRIVLCVVMLVSCAAFANDWEQAYRSDEWEDSSASVVLKKGEELLVLGAKIGSGRDGKQRLYVEQFVMDAERQIVKTICEDSEDDYSTVLNINGTNVQFAKSCIKDPNEEGSYLSMTPLSVAGVDYVLKQFRQRNSVTLTLRSVPVSITAKGFNEAWDNYGGDAL